MGLADKAEGIFHRVFQRLDVHVGRVHGVQHRIKRRRFTRTRRTRHDDDAFGTCLTFFNKLHVVFGEAQLVERDDRSAFIKNTQNDVFAMHGRQRRHAEVSLAAADVQVEAAVLRHQFIGDVHLRHDFQALADTAPVFLVQRMHGDKIAVHAVAQADKAFFRLEVQVGRAHFHRLEHQRVHKAHDGVAIGFVFAQRFKVGLGRSGIARQLFQNSVDGRGDAERFVDGIGQNFRRANQRRNRAAARQKLFQPVERDNVIRVGHRHDGGILRLIDGDGQHLVFQRVFFRNQLERGGVEHGFFRVELLKTRRFRKEGREDFGADKTHIDQNFANQARRALLFVERDFKLVLRNQTLFDEAVADTFVFDIAAGRQIGGQQINTRRSGGSSICRRGRLFKLQRRLGGGNICVIRRHAQS